MKKDINEILITKKQKYLVLLTVVLLLVAVGMFSYAFTGNINYVGLNTNKISNCAIDLSFKDSNPVRLTASYPMDYGTAKEYDPYTFYLKSNSVDCETLTYELYMASVCDTCGSSSCNLGDGNTCNCSSGYQIDGSLINYELKNVATGETTIGTIDEFNITAILLNNETHTYEMRMWINENATKEDIYINGNSSLSKNYCGKLNVKFGEGSQLGDSGNSYIEKDSSNANVPELASNMIPVIYDSENNTWIKADSTNTNLTWFNYTDKRWANAVTVTEVDGSRSDLVDADIGTPISMDRINTMWVWIPRFNAVMTDGQEGEYGGYCIGEPTVTTIDECESWSVGSSWVEGYLNPGAFNITFVNKNTSAHDAFTFGSQELSGFWMAKFEISHKTLSSSTNDNNLGCSNETCENAKEIEILPNKVSLRYNNVSNFFYAGRSMEQNGNLYGIAKEEIDTHVVKGSEWGAVVYLTQSIYGRCSSSTNCDVFGMNNNSSYLTGYGAPGKSHDDEPNGAYNTELGIDASTTGNVYGVYDMAGGADEYVMGVYWDGTKIWSGPSSDYNSGFNGCLGYNNNCSSTLETGIPFPTDSKYYNLYFDYINESSGLQHAIDETCGFNGDYCSAEIYLQSHAPWLMRGGYNSNLTYTGLFYFSALSGEAHYSVGTRVVAVK